MRGRHLFSFIGRTTTFYVLSSGIPPSLAFLAFFFYFDCVDFNLSWLDRIALRNLCVCFLSLPLASPALFIFYVGLKHWSLRCRGGFGGHDGLLRLIFLCVLNGGHEKGVDESFHLMERKEDCGLERRHGMITQWTLFFWDCSPSLSSSLV